MIVVHNFIHQWVVKELNLQIERKTKFRVTIGDGTALKGKGTCKRVKVELPKLKIVADFLVIESGENDVVLAMQWLSITSFIGVH